MPKDRNKGNRGFTRTREIKKQPDPGESLALTEPDYLDLSLNIRNHTDSASKRCTSQLIRLFPREYESKSTIIESKANQAIRAPLRESPVFG